MSPLGRGRVSGLALTAQAVATTAPAASMVVLPLMVAGLAPVAALATIVGAVVLVVLFALALTRFTRRQAAAGGPASFAYQGGGAPAALGVGVMILLKFLGSATLTLASGLTSLAAVLTVLGVGAGAAVLVGVLALPTLAVIAVVLVRGARAAMVALLGVEVGSLVLVLVVMWGSEPGRPVPTGPGDGSRLLLLALVTVFALAGFESATFFGPEVRRPLTTVTRVVLLTPLLCGALVVVAALAALTGHADALLAAYLHPDRSGAPAGLVVALHAGLACSWLASATGSLHAASRLVWSLGVGRALPGPVARAVVSIHPRYRTPHRVLLVLVPTIGVTGTLVATGLLVAPTGELRHLVRAAVVLAYVLVAVAALRFLTRIGERTLGAVVTTAVAALGGGALLVAYLVTLPGGGLGVALTLAVLLVAGRWWGRRRAGRATRLGAFDHAETEDVLPGSGAWARDACGDTVLVARGRSR